MKRLLLLTILIGLLFTSPNSFAQSSKPKRATIKYENGVKYVGEIRASLQKLPETADMANNKYMLSNSERAILRHVESVSDKVISPLQSMDDNLHPLVNYVVMPLFAFANASISFEHFALADIEGVTLSVFIALVLGKLLGIFSFTWLAVKSKLLNMPEHMDARSLLGVSMLGRLSADWRTTPTTV